MQQTPHLTPGDPAFADRIHNTHAGQAHWADSTTDTCRECVGWGFADEPHKRTNRGRLLDRPCTKFLELTGQKGPRVPHYAHACRFFTRNPDAPKGVREISEQGK
jgi:hypothetical protein